METTNPTRAHQIGRAALEFERQRTGHVPKSLSVVLNEDTLVITLRGALSRAEIALARDPVGAAQVREFHRELFANASEPLRREIQRITGLEVREASAEVEILSSVVAPVFTSGTLVQVFLLAGRLPAEAWSDSGPAEANRSSGPAEP